MCKMDVNAFLQISLKPLDPMHSYFNYYKNVNKKYPMLFIYAPDTEMLNVNNDFNIEQFRHYI